MIGTHLQTLHTHPHPQLIYSSQKLQHINMIVPPTLNIGGVYIGDTISLLKNQMLQDKKIMAVLSCNQETHCSINRIPSKINIKIMEMQDHQNYPIHVHFDTAYDFIEKHRNQGKNVLVQCYAGVSRSATIVCAYLIKKHQIKAEEAFRLVKEKRNRIKPNQGFWIQLQNYAREIHPPVQLGSTSDRKLPTTNQNEEDPLQPTKLAFINLIKFRNQKKQALSTTQSQKSSRVGKKSLNTSSQVQTTNLEHKSAFSRTFCDNSSSLQMHENRFFDRRHPLLNKSLISEKAYRSPLLTPQKHDSKQQISPSTGINTPVWNSHFNTDKDGRNQ